MLSLHLKEAIILVGQVTWEWW